MGDFEYLKAGYYVRWFNPSTNTYQYYWLKQEETEPGYIYKFQTAISATSAGSYEAVKDMQPSPGHLFEMLMGFQTRCDVFLQVPGGSAVGGTDQRPTETSTFEAVGFYNMMMSPFYHPDPITHIYFAYLGNLLYYPWVKAYNPTPITLTPRIRFVGKMFETQLVQDTDLISRLDKRVIPWTPISLGMLVGKGRTAQS
jgi:hypothetical protein